VLKILDRVFSSAYNGFNVNNSREGIMQNDWHNVYITDKSGKKFFNASTSPMATFSEIKNLKRHLEQAKTMPQHYKFLDVATAVIMLDGTVYSEPSASDIDVDAMLDELDGLL
jgi:hypothetical protein